MSLQHYRDKVARMPAAELRMRHNKLSDRLNQLTAIGNKLQLANQAADYQINLLAQAVVNDKLAALDTAIGALNDQ